MCDSVEVSIICNTYNHEKYIRDALDGFIMQKTSFPFVIFVHDDASTDETANIIREYEQKYPDLIKPIYQTENQFSKHDGTIWRVQKNRAEGKYVATCEGDDYWLDPLKLQKQYDFMENHPEYTLCGCSTKWMEVLKNKETGRSRTDRDRDVSLEEFLNPKNGRPFPYVSFFFRREVWANTPNWGFPVGDLPMTYHAAIQGKVRMLADVMCVYRWNVEGSWTDRNSNSKKRASICEDMIRGYERMNADTDYRYSESIQKAILQQKYMLALMNHDFKALRSEELIQVFKNKRLTKRIADCVRCTMPTTFRVLKKVFRKAR